MKNKKPKTNIEVLLMREACGELEIFSDLYEAWFTGQIVEPPAPEELFWSLNKYASALKRYRMGYDKNPPF